MMMMVLGTVGVLAGCPGAEWLDAGNGQCYAVFTQTLAFSDIVEAEMLCHSNASELASIPDFNIESLVLELLRNVSVCPTVAIHASKCK